MRNFVDFKPWEKFLDGRDEKLTNPFAKDMLGKGACFLYCEITAPIPAATMWGKWYAYPAPQAMASHLCYGILPDLFGTWLCRDEWDPKPGKPITLEALFEGAIKADNRYVVDIARMKAISKLIEAAMWNRSASPAWRDTEAACRRFNSRWKKAGTWSFVLKPFDSPEALARDIIRSGVVDIEGKEFRDLAARALFDRRAQKQFKALLEEAAVY